MDMNSALRIKWRVWVKVLFTIVVCFQTALHSTNLISSTCLSTGNDGDAGDESCAEMLIHLNVPALAGIMSLQPFNLGQFDYKTPPAAIGDFCVWHSSETFSMTVDSLNSQGDNYFYLLGAKSSDRVRYDVTWYNQPGGEGIAYAIADKENITQTGLFLNQVTSYQCTAANVSLKVSIPLNNLKNKAEDRYSDTLTVTVAVE